MLLFSPCRSRSSLTSLSLFCPHRTFSEVEVLQSIYLDELHVTQEPRSSHPWEVHITLFPSTAQDPEAQFVRLTLQLSLPAQYPNSPPEISIQNPRGLSDEKIHCIQCTLADLAKSSVGGPMLYELIEKGKEILTESNVPYGQCIICLFGFQEDEAFTKTACYHYFHSHCLARYVEHREMEIEAQKAELALDKTSSLKQQELKVLCPVCREPLTYDWDSLQATAPPQTPLLPFSPGKEFLRKWAELQEILTRQRLKGGVIDPEEESNRFLLHIHETPSEEAGNKSILNPEESATATSPAEHSAAPVVETPVEAAPIEEDGSRSETSVKNCDQSDLKDPSVQAEVRTPETPGHVYQDMGKNRRRKDERPHWRGRGQHRRQHFPRIQDKGEMHLERTFHRMGLQAETVSPSLPLEEMEKVGPESVLPVQVRVCQSERWRPARPVHQSKSHVMCAKRLDDRNCDAASPLSRDARNETQGNIRDCSTSQSERVIAGDGKNLRQMADSCDNPVEEKIIRNDNFSSGYEPQGSTQRHSNRPHGGWSRTSGPNPTRGGYWKPHFQGGRRDFTPRGRGRGRGQIGSKRELKKEDV
uniref:E3 ubiquitin-protein ligase RNF25 n=1 Tax=Erpetoichthys calabaricus TaxID=27687 RepID=A0A8C4SE52_ERPCA